MGNPTLEWSPVQLRLANQVKVQSIGRVSILVVHIEGMKTHADFDVIEVVGDDGSYPTLLGIGWASDRIDPGGSKKETFLKSSNLIKTNTKSKCSSI